MIKILQQSYYCTFINNSLYQCIFFYLKVQKKYSQRVKVQLLMEASQKFIFKKEGGLLHLKYLNISMIITILSQIEIKNLKKVTCSVWTLDLSRVNRMHLDLKCTSTAWLYKRKQQKTRVLAFLSVSISGCVQFFSYKMRQQRAKILCLCIGMSTLTLSV
jgi:hypothetical protein